MQSNNRPCSSKTAHLLIGESVDDVTPISFWFFPTLLSNKTLTRKESCERNNVIISMSAEGDRTTAAYPGEIGAAFTSASSLA